MITIRALIDANKRALDERTLGAQRGYRDCKYDYGDGSHCAVGVALSPSQLAVLARRHRGATPVDCLGPLLQVEDIHLFRLTQALHDNWAMGNTGYSGLSYIAGHIMEPAIGEFIRTAGHEGRPFDEALFRDFINLLDKTFPAEGAA